jgi:hypothetical protein
MNRIRIIGRRISLLTGLVTALLAAAGTVPAFASPAPPLNGGFGSAPAGGGTPGWQIALIIVAVAFAAAAVVTVLVHRARAARRQAAAPQRVPVPGK